jgi:hypothetical protein
VRSGACVDDEEPLETVWLLARADGCGCSWVVVAYASAHQPCVRRGVFVLQVVWVPRAVVCGVRLFVLRLLARDEDATVHCKRWTVLEAPRARKPHFSCLQILSRAQRTCNRRSIASLRFKVSGGVQ